MTARNWHDTDRGRSKGASPPPGSPANQSGRAKQWSETDRGRAAAQRMGEQPPARGAGRSQGRPQSPGRAAPAPAEVAILPTLTLKPGTRGELRTRLEAFLGMGIPFALGLFDAVFRDAPETSAPASPLGAPRLDAAALGVKVVQIEHPQGGAGLQISTIVPDSLAAKGGLQEGDLLTQVDDFVVNSPAELDAGIEAGLWDSHLFYIERNGEPKRISVRSVQKSPETKS